MTVKDDTKWQVVRLEEEWGGEILVQDNLSKNEAEALVDKIATRASRAQHRAEPMRPLKVPTFEESIKRGASACSLDPGLVTAAQLESVDVKSLTKAVIFCYAGWSGPAVNAFRMLCSVMAASATTFEIVVINNDELTDEKNFDKAKILLGRALGGFGETCWVRDGIIIAQDDLGKPSNYKQEKYIADRPVRADKVPLEAVDMQTLIERRIEQVSA